MSNVGSNYPLPRVYGSELETSIQLTQVALAPDPLEIDDYIETFKVTDPLDYEEFIPRTLDTGTEYLSNGFRFYDGLYEKDGVQKIEIATPECQTIQQAVVATRVGELVVIRGVEQVVEADNYVMSARIQKRVVDSYGNTWGAHDNFGFDPNPFAQVVANQHALAQFLAARSFLTGAGMVYENGTYTFAQKPSGISVVNGYGFFGRYYRMAASEDERFKRIEISSVDANVSDWSVRMRLGSAAILFATLASGRTAQLQPYLESIDGALLLEKGRQLNIADVKEDGRVVLSRDQVRGVDMLQRLAEIYLEHIGPNIDEKDYAAIARELYVYCDDMRRLSDGRKSVTDLADRADWALKLAIITKRMERDRKNGISRRLGDFRSRADDLLYDHTAVLPKKFEEGCFRELGYGFKQRARGKFRYTAPQKLIENAFHTPPETRAALRSRLLTTGITVTSVDWGHVTLENEDGYARIEMRDALDADLPEEIPDWLQTRL